MIIFYITPTSFSDNKDVEELSFDELIRVKGGTANGFCLDKFSCLFGTNCIDFQCFNPGGNCEVRQINASQMDVCTSFGIPSHLCLSEPPPTLNCKLTYQCVCSIPCCGGNSYCVATSLLLGSDKRLKAKTSPTPTVCP